MAKFGPNQIKDFEALASKFLAQLDLKCADIQSGRDAWTVASRSGISAIAYQDREVTDGMIQTALEKVFPNAKFLDAKVY